MTTEPGVFGPHQTGELVSFFDEHGFAILRGLLSDDQVDAIQAECEALQRSVGAGALPARHGNPVFDRPGAVATLPAYVTCVTEVAPLTRAMSADGLVASVSRRLLGEDAWLLESKRFGVVYQDARPGTDSTYTRIGWHSDWQSGPADDVWPSVAYTLHVDATSPANGFLRVVPGSHRWATPCPAADIYGAPPPPGSASFGGWTDEPPPFAMPSRFDKVPGEVAVYCDRGDVLFHDCYLWHSAARATDDEGVRRHVRGSWFAGTPYPDDDDESRFVKNAAR
jgi:ectoine hydroxylase-related dioxygenase (phytanoyl-CoA dioxygenase family)